MTGQAECLVLYGIENTPTVGNSIWMKDVRSIQACTHSSERLMESPSPPEPAVKSTTLYETTLKPRSLYESLQSGLDASPRVRQEVALKKRVGFYKLRGQLGVGNFSKVRLGVHLLTNGKLMRAVILFSSNGK